MVRMPGIHALCREHAVINLLRTLRFDSFLEIGVGDGHLVRSMARQGLKGKGIDISPEAIEQARKMIGEYASRVTLECSDITTVTGTFDCILMLQVLEHVEDDEACLVAVKKLLSCEGFIVLSVPAHRKKWGYLDRVGGHYRRYDRDTLLRLLDRAGFICQSIYSLGVPLVNWLRPWDEWCYRRYYNEHKLEYESNANKTTKSGYVLVPWVLGFPAWMRFFINRFIVFPFLALQRVFFQTDAGLNYLVLAKVKRVSV